RPPGGCPDGLPRPPPALPRGRSGGRRGRARPRRRAAPSEELALRRRGFRSSLRVRFRRGGAGCSRLDLAPRRFQLGFADLQVLAGLADRLQRVLQAELAVLELAQPLVECLQGLLVSQFLAHSAWSTVAARRPAASRTRTLRPGPVWLAAVRTAPESASCVML